MPNVKIINQNSFDYVEMFNGVMIKIPAGQSIDMEYFEANQFLAKMNSLSFDKEGRIDPRSYKMLKIEPDDEKLALEEINRSNSTDEKSSVFVCHACGKEFRTKNGLLKHIKGSHVSDMADKEARDELLDDEGV